MLGLKALPRGSAAGGDAAHVVCSNIAVMLQRLEDDDEEPMPSDACPMKILTDRMQTLSSGAQQEVPGSSSLEERQFASLLR